MQGMNKGFLSTLVSHVNALVFLFYSLTHCDVSIVFDTVLTTFFLSKTLKTIKSSY